MIGMDNWDGGGRGQETGTALACKPCCAQQMTLGNKLEFGPCCAWAKGGTFSMSRPLWCLHRLRPSRRVCAGRGWTLCSIAPEQGSAYTLSAATAHLWVPWRGLGAGRSRRLSVCLSVCPSSPSSRARVSHSSFWQLDSLLQQVPG